jgi:hypothetical protein
MHQRDDPDLVLAAGLDTPAEQVAICELYRTLRVARHARRIGCSGPPHGWRGSHNVESAAGGSLLNSTDQRSFLSMINPQLADRIVSMLEDAICTREQAVTERLSAGVDAAAEEAALPELYRRLGVAHYFQAHRVNQLSTWPPDFYNAR